MSIVRRGAQGNLSVGGRVWPSLWPHARDGIILQLICTGRDPTCHGWCIKKKKKKKKKKNTGWNPVFLKNKKQKQKKKKKNKSTTLLKKKKKTKKTN
eukprot:NODE_28240_length_484_cov_2.229692.p2 GENE.NODE_28240_length_484_cov_2.229692~~NODE_28240_length_484_cov_2.229692.p2  ORF type:complete len:97 (+),score=42.00 NODE_28240_length_484_cov_2.229692:133-423(+)